MSGIRLKPIRLLMLAAFFSLLPPRMAQAGFTESLPEGTFLLDINYNYSWLNKAYDNNGDKGPLVNKIERYEPGGGMQGVLIPNADVQYSIMIFQLQYGILDNLSVGLGIPLVLRTDVSPSFQWEPGDYQPQLGRAYSEEDFWQWAQSMGQPKPTKWSGNKGALGDIVLGSRLRYTDWIEWCRRVQFGGAVTITGAIPTGRQADPEEIVSAGTTMWDLHSQGDMSFHLSFDKMFKEELDDRLTLGLDLFYELLLPHTYTAPAGTTNPLLLNYAPYIGKSYVIDPGDFIGFSVQTDIVPYKGPAWASWISKGDISRAESFPPIIALSLRYTFAYLEQSHWDSKSDLWDYTQEDRWRPGYKNILTGTLLVSFLRLGAPLQVYATYRTLNLIPGKNTRAADVITAGIRIPIKFW